ncbi:MAG TPA: 3-deoxy-7-phosphoheptulonate synthase, partial [Gemmatimonas sp.]|nr:3-deoxy-7-phosphoheptulonate synthase [Gemmatimonas sp.]
MLVVMQPNATSTDIERVCDEIVRQGFKPLPMPGATRTAIGLLGDDSQIDWSNIEGLAGVASV